MRILVVSYLFPNSIHPNYGIFVLNRLQALLPYCDIRVINPIPWFPFCSRIERYRDYDLIPRWEIMNGIQVFHPRFFMIPRFLKLLDMVTYALAAVPLALRIRKTFPFDLIDLHWTYPDLPCGRLLARLTGRKLLVTVRGREAFYGNEGGFREIAVRRLLRGCNFAIALSDDLKNRCISEGVSPDRVAIVANGVDTDLFHYKGRDKCREKLGLAMGDKIVLSVGSLTYGKGFDRLIRIFPKIIEEYPEGRLYIVGSAGPAGNYSEQLLRLTRSLGLERSVRFVGEIRNSDLIFWYNAADVFCLPSRSEGSPNVLNEALACGCPAVTTDVGAASEFVRKTSMGIVVANAEDALLAGLRSAIPMSFDRRRIATQMTDFKWSDCARQLIRIYRDA